MHETFETKKTAVFEKEREWKREGEMKSWMKTNKKTPSNQNRLKLIPDGDLNLKVQLNRAMFECVLIFSQFLTGLEDHKTIKNIIMTPKTTNWKSEINNMSASRNVSRLRVVFVIESKSGCQPFMLLLKAYCSKWNVCVFGMTHFVDLSSIATVYRPMCESWNCLRERKSLCWDTQNDFECQTSKFVCEKKHKKKHERLLEVKSRFVFWEKIKKWPRKMLRSELWCEISNFYFF